MPDSSTKMNGPHGFPGGPEHQHQLRADRFMRGARINLDLLRLTRFRNRHLKIQDTILQVAAYMFQIETGGQRQSSIKLTIGQLRIRTLVEAIWRFALTLDH